MVRMIVLQFIIGDVDSSRGRLRGGCDVEMGSNTEAAEQLLWKQFFHLQQPMAHSLFVGIAQKSFQCFSIQLNSIGPVILAETFLRQPRMLKAPGNRKHGMRGVESTSDTSVSSLLKCLE